VRRALLVLRLLVAVAVVGFVYSRVDPGAAADRLVAAPWWAWAVPAVLLTLNSGLHALRLVLVLPDPAPPLRTAMRAVLIGNFFGLFLPTGGGEAAKAVAIAKAAGGYEPAFAAMFTSRLLELVPWGLLCAWGAVGVLPSRLPGWIPIAVGAAAGFGGVVLAVAILVRGMVRIPLPEGIATRVARVARLRPPPGRLAACLAAAVPFAGINCFVVWVVLRAYGVEVRYVEVLGLIPTLDVVISLPVTVSGVGVREMVFVDGLRPWGADATTAVAVALTRWSGELFRAGIGGVLFLVGPGRPAAGSSQHRFPSGP